MTPAPTLRRWLVVAGVSLAAPLLASLCRLAARAGRAPTPRAAAGWQPIERRPRRPASIRPEHPTSGDRLARRTLRIVAALAVVSLLAGVAIRWWPRSTARDDAAGFRITDQNAAPADPDASVPVPDRVPDGIEEYRPDPRTQTPAALEGQDWILGIRNADTSWAIDPKVAFRPVNPYRLLDFGGPGANVVDGRRTTWTPPACGCRRVSLWMYGGSTTYGLDQRDDHTIPSELAKVASEHGITVDVRNLGELGSLHWTEAERFAWDLTLDPAPDMALFYDGLNDLWSTNALNDLHTGDVAPVYDPSLLDVWRTSGRSDGPVPEGPDGSRLIGRQRGAKLEIPAAARVTVERYDRSRQLSRASAAQHDVLARYIWQPTRIDRPLVESEPHSSTSGENDARLRSELMRRALPDDVIDLSRSLADVDGPLFTDDAHHNERGARIIAEAIYARIEPDLRRLAASPARSDG